MDRRWFVIGSVNGLLAVGLGAFGAHGLKGRLGPDELAAFEVGVRYQMYHALALLGIAWIASIRPSPVASGAGVCMVTGVVLFSGSIYALSLTEWNWVWPLTPAGGLFLMAGWLLLAIAPFAGGGPQPTVGGET